jgi:hypothetical protein
VKPQSGHRLPARWVGLCAVVGLCLCLGVWLWPIGFGGRMPVGGDASKFSIGLMAVLRAAYQQGRLPLWNDLWGYGFPGLAESQMGVFYPPHWLLYGLTSTEAAYTWSMVLHTMFAGLGAFWMARRFGVSAAGAALAGFAWATSGFFLIHLPHQWGYTAGSWMPWALGLGWLVVEGRGGWWAAWLLGGLLAIQVLPGHFQLAFCTQVCLIGVALWALVDRAEDESAGVRVRRSLALIIAFAVGFPLAAMQVWPTYRLAQAAQPHDYEYLSGFAATPIHLVSYVAPGLFHWSPLWRPLAWTPFHTSPEEHMAYVGLAPLVMAIGAIAHSFRRDRAVRVLTLLAAGTLVLSLGPYVPGFDVLARVPGFSFFRAPARWSLATGLALCVLAGKGFDRFELWPRPGRLMVRFVLAALVYIAAVVGGFELALAATRNTGWPAVINIYDRVLRALPWPENPSLRDVAERTRMPQNSLQALEALAREGLPTAGARRFEQERLLIYIHELGPTAVWLLGVALLGAFAKRPLHFRAGVVCLTLLDLLSLGRHRPIDVAPLAPLEAQSPLLARLAREPYGARSIDPMFNLSMAAHAAPLFAYRTLDLPAMRWLTALAQGPILGQRQDATVRAALRAAGARVRVFSPYDPPSGLDKEKRETFADPELAAWLFGRAWSQSRAGSAFTKFTLWWPDQNPTRAWLLDDRALSNQSAQGGEPWSVMRVVQNAQPLADESPRPERRTIRVNAAKKGIVLVSQLFYPEWTAVWRGPDGSTPATIDRAFDGWQAVAVPGPGSWTLELEYAGRDVWQGLTVSAWAWGIGILGFMARWWWASRKQKGALEVARA